MHVLVYLKETFTTLFEILYGNLHLYAMNMKLKVMGLHLLMEVSKFW
jgi:hypothetical protein